MAISGYQIRINNGAPVTIGNVLTHTFYGVSPGGYSVDMRAFDDAVPPNYSNWCPPQLINIVGGSASSYALSNLTTLRTLDGDAATDAELLNFVMTMISDLAFSGTTATGSLTGYAVANHAIRRSLDGATWERGEVIDFAMTMAADLMAGGNLSAYSVGNFAPIRALNGDAATGSSFDDLVGVILTLADDLGAVNTTP